MKWIRSLNDLSAYGIEPLTGEACGLMYRILCDVTADGLRILEKCLGVKITPAVAWNCGSPNDPHIGSVMLAQPMLVPIGVFAPYWSPAAQSAGCTRKATWLALSPATRPKASIATARCTRARSPAGSRIAVRLATATCT